jgi:hypothetical protein
VAPAEDRVDAVAQALAGRIAAIARRARVGRRTSRKLEPLGKCAVTPSSREPAAEAGWKSADAARAFDCRLIAYGERSRPEFVSFVDVGGSRLEGIPSR